MGQLILFMSALSLLLSSIALGLTEEALLGSSVGSIVDSVLCIIWLASTVGIIVGIGLMAWAEILV